MAAKENPLPRPRPEGPLAPAQTVEVVVPSDANDLTFISRAIYVGTGGDISARLVDGTSALFKNAAAGSILPIRCAGINATLTTAQNLVSLS